MYIGNEEEEYVGMPYQRAGHRWKACMDVLIEGSL